MVKVFEGTEHEFYLDGYLKTNLDVAKKVIRKDWDMVFVVDGTEGAGKSVLAQQMAFYADPTLNIDRIVFNDTDFKNVIENAKPYQAIILDEAYGGLSSRSAMSKVNKSIIQMLTVIRAKNLFIFIVLPTFFDLDKYVALWRSRALINVYTREGFKRGAFKFFNSNKKKNLYVNGKKYYNYMVEQPNFRGSFANHYCVDEKEYREKKEKTSLEQVEQDTLYARKTSITKEVKAAVAYSLAHNVGNLDLSQTDISKILKTTQQSISNYLKIEENRMNEDPNTNEKKYIDLMSK